jgi:hypothetical protein
LRFAALGDNLWIVSPEGGEAEVNVQVRMYSNRHKETVPKPHEECTVA